MSQFKNIIIFIVAAVILVLVYIFLIKKGPEQDALVSTSSNSTDSSLGALSQGSVESSEFLNVLLSIKSIKLDDSIFADVAFDTLRDSSITLTADGNEGRPNPFAPIGTDVSAPAPTTPTPATTPTSTSTGSTVGGSIFAPSATPASSLPSTPTSPTN